jgi:hypothetical protein
MQSLVNAVRKAGATQPLLVGGLDWSSDERSWRAYEPHDPRKSLIVSFHTYNTTYCKHPVVLEGRARTARQGRARRRG